MDNQISLSCFARGYCISAKKHKQIKEIPEKICYKCHGYGCERCNETGLYREGKIYERTFYSFNFSVDEDSYSWHQPADFLGFNPIITADGEETEMPEIEKNKPINLPLRKLKEAKELIKWFLEKEKLCLN